MTCSYALRFAGENSASRLFFAGLFSARPTSCSMVERDENNISRWSYYDEYLKSNKIKKARHQFPDMDDLVVESIKSGEIERAMDLRAQLPTVCTTPAILKKF